MRKVGLIIMALTLPLIGAGALAQQVPATGAVATPPPGPGLDLINERCGFCHTTGQGMADRGAEVSPEEIKTITSYLAKNYASAPGAGPSAGGR